MKLKLDENGNAALQDGKPVYLKDDGSEVAFDVTATTQTITRLNAEAKGHRERAEKAEGALKGFEGIDDPKKALEALGVIANLDAKKLVDAGEIEKVKAEISKAFQTQLDDANGKATKAYDLLNAEMIGGSFARSKVIADKLAIPAELVQAYFGKAFSIEEGKVVAKDGNGNKLYSASNPGELAGFDEALEMLVSQYPGRDHILKAPQANGSGSQQSAGAGQTKSNFGGSKAERIAAMEQLVKGK